MKTRTFLNLVSLILTLAIIAGCGKKEETAKPTTQVAAKVNADEITVHQINYAMSRAQNIAPESADRVKREILNRLIDQHIAKQQATEKKLDRKPEVMQAVEAARTEILARAFLDSIVATLPKPTLEDVKKYYAENPALFAQRRIYNLQELVVSPSEGLPAKLESQVAKSRTMEEVAAWLTSQNIKFSANRGARAAEVLPLALLPILQSFKDGEMRVVALGGSLNVYRVLATQSAPVTETTATPRIQQFLFNRQASESIAAEMKKLKDKTEISYLGEFSAAGEESKKAAAAAKAKEIEKAKSDAEVEAKARAEAKAKIEADTKANTEALAKAREARLAEEAKAKADAAAKTKSAPANAPQVQRETIEKGLRGLK